MPALFVGHGSPMIAIEDTQESRELKALGQQILEQFGRPRGILAISSHWYTRGGYVNRSLRPPQVYDMYGFPQKLYDHKYPVTGDPELADRVQQLSGGKIHGIAEWGIDHGIWSVLTHLFPEADIPVAEMSVDGTLTGEEAWRMGQALASLRREGYLILGSGNIVHNLRDMDWSRLDLSPENKAFARRVNEAVKARNDAELFSFEDLPYAAVAMSSPEHFVPLLYVLGASRGEKPLVFNDTGTHDALSMTGYAFGMQPEPDKKPENA